MLGQITGWLLSETAQHSVSTWLRPHVRREAARRFGAWEDIKISTEQHNKQLYLSVKDMNMATCSTCGSFFVLCIGYKFQLDRNQLVSGPTPACFPGQRMKGLTEMRVTSAGDVCLLSSQWDEMVRVKLQNSR